nr:MAG TPA: hypothetical protein [Caudoviricetes sp.]
MPLRLNTHKFNFIYAEWATNTIPERGIRPADLLQPSNHLAPNLGQTQISKKQQGDSYV